mmetsp:Transcript_5125/g.15650  ORF Transcript_5125/g.15650 Transcript_5125/m.15650 type:complete len:294 (-) Transcript_5125:983-1864(-)
MRAHPTQPSSSTLPERQQAQPRQQSTNSVSDRRERRILTSPSCCIALLQLSLLLRWERIWSLHWWLRKKTRCQMLTVRRASASSPHLVHQHHTSTTAAAMRRQGFRVWRSPHENKQKKTAGGQRAVPTRSRGRLIRSAAVPRPVDRHTDLTLLFELFAFTRSKPRSLHGWVRTSHRTAGTTPPAAQTQLVRLALRFGHHRRRHRRWQGHAPRHPKISHRGHLRRDRRPKARLLDLLRSSLWRSARRCSATRAATLRWRARSEKEKRKRTSSQAMSWAARKHRVRARPSWSGRF